MPLLVLARHAHTVPAHVAGTDDYNRPLSTAGELQAQRMGQHLAGVDGTIDTVIASSAVRTAATADAVAAGLSLPPSAVQREDSLYNSGSDAWLEALSLIPDEVEGAVIVGHEPTVSEVVALLADGGASGQVPHFPPSSVAVFRLESWNQVNGQAGEHGQAGQQVAGAARPEEIRHFKEA